MHTLCINFICANFKTEIMLHLSFEKQDICTDLHSNKKPCIHNYPRTGTKFVITNSSQFETSYMRSCNYELNKAIC